MKAVIQFEVEDREDFVKQRQASQLSDEDWFLMNDAGGIETFEKVLEDHEKSVDKLANQAVKEGREDERLRIKNLIKERIEEIKKKESSWKEEKQDIDELDNTENVARIKELEELRERISKGGSGAD